MHHAGRPNPCSESSEAMGRSVLARLLGGEGDPPPSPPRLPGRELWTYVSPSFLLLLLFILFLLFSAKVPPHSVLFVLLRLLISLIFLFVKSLVPLSLRRSIKSSARLTRGAAPTLAPPPPPPLPPPPLTP